MDCSQPLLRTFEAPISGSSLHLTRTNISPFLTVTPFLLHFQEPTPIILCLQLCWGAFPELSITWALLPSIPTLNFYLGALSMWQWYDYWPNVTALMTPHCEHGTTLVLCSVCNSLTQCLANEEIS